MMARVETWVGCDLDKAVQVRQLGGFLFTQDNEGNLLGAKVTQDGEPVNLTGTVVGYAILADGQTVDITGDSTGIQNGNEAFIILPQLAYSVPGQISIVIKLTTADTITTLAAFCGYVYRSKTGQEVVPPGTPIPDLSTLEEAIRNANTAATAANTAAAAAENVDISMSQDGDVITITTTNRQGETETATLTDQSEAIAELKSTFDANVITESAGPAPIVSVTDGADGMPMRKVEVAIEPVQDLHGYDSPWPAGGGKNLLDTSSVQSQTVLGVTITRNLDGTILVNGTATGNITTGSTGFTLDYSLNVGEYIFSGCPSGGSTTNGYSQQINIGSDIYYDTGNGVTFSVTETGKTVKLTIPRIISGTVCSNLLFKPMIRLSSVSDATFAPYSNICPISGWTGAKVTRTGKNLVDVSDQVNVTNGTKIVATGLPTGGFLTASADISDVTPANGLARIRIQYMLNDNLVVSSNATIHSGRSVATLLVPKDATDVAIVIQRNNNATSFSAKNIMVEHGQTASTYESYQGQTYEVTFPSEAGTVYGGTLDVVSGKLVVDRAMVSADSLTWSEDARRNRWISGAIANIKPVSNGTLLTTVVSDTFKAFINNQIYDNTALIGFAQNGSSIVVRNGTTATRPVGCVFVYELATPATYTLSALEVIETLKGNNVLWADTGNIAVEYPADTKMYIDRKITEAVANALNA